MKAQMLGKLSTWEDSTLLNSQATMTTITTRGNYYQGRRRRRYCTSSILQRTRYHSILPLPPVLLRATCSRWRRRRQRSLWWTRMRGGWAEASLQRRRDAGVGGKEFERGAGPVPGLPLPTRWLTRRGVNRVGHWHVTTGTICCEIDNMGPAGFLWQAGLDGAR